VILVSGRDGSVLRSLTVPDSAESYYSPVVYRQRPGTDVVLFGTGGETHRGSLWVLPLTDLYAGDIRQVQAWNYLLLNFRQRLYNYDNNNNR